MDLTVTTTNASLGLAGAVIVAYDVRALPLLVVPLVTVFLAYRAYATERQRHESLEFLYETTRTLSRSPEIVVALEGLLARSRRGVPRRDRRDRPVPAPRATRRCAPRSAPATRAT